MKKIIAHIMCIFLVNTVFSQTRDTYFDKFSIKIDTANYSLQKNTFLYQNEKYIFIKTSQNQEVADLIIAANADAKLEKFELLNSIDYSILDSLRFYDDAYYRAKIKFSDFENGKSVGLNFSIKLQNGKNVNYQIKLFSYKETTLNFENETIDVFLDEEKTIEIPCNDPYSIRLSGDFTDGKDEEIHLSTGINTLKLKIKPQSLGTKAITLKLKTIKPFINQNNELTYELNPIKIMLNAIPNRIDYLNPERNVIYYNQDYKISEDIQFDFNKNLLLRKTYRVEDQAESGGNLIAEIFTQSQVGNSNKVLCRVRTFSLHQVADGYLYIKDGDKTRFITNFNIIEKPRIDDVSIMHDGEDWTQVLSVSPGEQLEVRVKGKGISNSLFQFVGAENVQKDTTRITDEVAFFNIKIPKNITKKKINLFMNSVGTQFSFQIREFQRPTDYDFVMVNYGEKSMPLTHSLFDKPIFYEKSVKDINLIFDASKIDKNGKLNGKQYLNIEVKILNSKNDLIEIQNINNVVVCPDESSPRGTFYDLKDCRNQSVSLNDILVHKTYSLDPFTQIYITISHDAQKYGGTPGYTRKLKLIMKKRVNFDLQVSFPAGLLLKKFNEPGYGNLSGISIAFIAQLSFYDGEKVNKFKPYNFGAGFIALDAFNYSDNSGSRDFGIVVLATLVPIQSAKLSFPLYLGGGYLLKAKVPFILFGPGLRFNF